MAATAASMVPEIQPVGRALISTIEPVSGGVPRMTAFVANSLRRQGYEVTLAYYAPYSRAPELSVPFQKLGHGRPGTRAGLALDGYAALGIGAWLPELEFTHYRAGPDWRRLIDAADVCFAVSGSCLAAWPFVATGRPFVAWVATPWEADRRDRVARFPWHRRALDRIVNAPVLRHMERKILKSGTILPLSRYTGAALDAIAGRRRCGEVLSMPVDTEALRPAPDRVVPGRVGFSGRLDDPRKNVTLLLDALDRARVVDSFVHAVLLGGPAGADLEVRIEQLGLANAVEVVDYVPHQALPDRLQTLDVFVVPSHQEGLCISAIEAMACGVPVVSTRCGGPEDFVRDDENGYLVDATPAAVAKAVRRIVAHRSLRKRLGEGARRTVCDRYTTARAESVLGRALKTTFSPGSLAQGTT